MKSLVSDGYGCGGNCSFRWYGESALELVWSAEGDARLSDRGTLEQSQSDPDGYSTTKRTWDFGWVGKWTGNETRRTIDMKRVKSSCSVSVKGRKRGNYDKCATLSPRLLLVCDWGNIPGLRGDPPVGAPPMPSSAWVCRAQPSPARFPGTELPWVFAPTTLRRHDPGSLDPNAYFAPWVEPSPKAAP